MNPAGFPVIRVKGDPLERGRQYGSQAAELIRKCIAAYTTIFGHYAGWDWPKVREIAGHYLQAIRSYRPHLVDEMEAMAQGAGLALEDILALNVRTEILNSAIAREAGSHECTAFVALPDVTATTHTLIGQNWDWKPLVSDTVLLLEVEDERLPNFVTVVEAGLLAKVGMNATGIGLATNMLVSDQDTGEPGVPYHVILRGILESETFAEAVEILQGQPLASAANYLIADRQGYSANLEAVPGSARQVISQPVSSGSYVHTNHYRSEDPSFTDVGALQWSDSPLRLQRMQTYLKQGSAQLALGQLKAALADHQNYPNGICCHPDLSKPNPERYASIASIIMDLNSATLWLARGNPCESTYQQYDFRKLFGVG